MPLNLLKTVKILLLDISRCSVSINCNSSNTEYWPQ